MTRWEVFQDRAISFAVLVGGLFVTPFVVFVTLLYLVFATKDALGKASAMMRFLRGDE